MLYIRIHNTQLPLWVKFSVKLQIEVFHAKNKHKHSMQAEEQTFFNLGQQQQQQQSQPKHLRQKVSFEAALKQGNNQVQEVCRVYHADTTQNEIQLVQRRRFGMMLTADAFTTYLYPMLVTSKSLLPVDYPNRLRWHHMTLHLFILQLGWRGWNFRSERFITEAMEAKVDPGLGM